MKKKGLDREGRLASGTAIDLFHLTCLAETRGERDEEAERELGRVMARLGSRLWLDVVSGRSAALAPGGEARLEPGLRRRRRGKR